MKEASLFLIGFLLAALGWIALANWVPRTWLTYNSLVSHAIVEAKGKGFEQLPRGMEPGIALVGGSNVLNGISAALMEKETGMPTRNYGYTSHMGPEMILHIVEPKLQSGDIVIMAWEYFMYNYHRSQSPPPAYMNLAFGSLSGYYDSLPSLDKYYLSLQLPETVLLDSLY